MRNLECCSAAHLDNGSDELFEKVVLEEVRPAVMNEIDEQSLDVGPVLILIRHDHHLPVTKSLHTVCVFIFVPIISYSK